MDPPPLFSPGPAPQPLQALPPASGAEQQLLRTPASLQGGGSEVSGSCRPGQALALFLPHAQLVATQVVVEGLHIGEDALGVWLLPHDHHVFHLHQGHAVCQHPVETQASARLGGLPLPAGDWDGVRQRWVPLSLDSPCPPCPYPTPPAASEAGQPAGTAHPCCPHAPLPPAYTLPQLLPCSPCLQSPPQPLWARLAAEEPLECPCPTLPFAPTPQPHLLHQGLCWARPQLLPASSLPLCHEQHPSQPPAPCPCHPTALPVPGATPNPELGLLSCQAPGRSSASGAAGTAGSGTEGRVGSAPTPPHPLVVESLGVAGGCPGAEQSSCCLPSSQHASQQSQLGSSAGCDGTQNNSPVLSPGLGRRRLKLSLRLGMEHSLTWDLRAVIRAGDKMLPGSCSAYTGLASWLSGGAG